LDDEEETDSGAAYLFQIQADDSVDFIDKLKAADAGAGDDYGNSVVVNGIYVSVGAGFEDTSSDDAGTLYLISTEPLKEMYIFDELDSSKTEDFVGDIVNFYKSIKDPYHNLSFKFTEGDVDMFDLSDDVFSIPEALDFEDPEDADENNKYVTTLEISDKDSGDVLDNIDITTIITDVYYFDLEKLHAIKDDADDGDEGDLFGKSVSISGDYMVVGANKDDETYDDAGSVYIYKRRSDTKGDVVWLEKLQASDVKGASEYGTCVSIDNQYVVVGAPLDDGSTGTADEGNAYLIKIAADDDISEKDDFQPDDVAENDYFGSSIDIDGDYIVAGAIGVDKDDSNPDFGAAYLFKKDSDDSVSQLAKMMADDGRQDDAFGNSIAISGDYIVVGSYLEDDGGDTNNAGAVYVFRRNSDNADDITQIAKLQAGDGDDVDTDDNFGYSVAIDGDYIVVGAPYEDPKSGDVTISNAGSVYVFKRNSDSDISQIANIKAKDAEEDDHFGNSVDISGAYIVVGAFNEDSNGDNAGSIYTFKINSDDKNDVDQIKKIQAYDAYENDLFGTSVSIDGDYVFSGASEKERQSDGATKVGNAYIFYKDHNQHE